MTGPAAGPPPDDAATTDRPVHVHSVQEEYFYLMVHPCACGGPWMSREQTVDERPGGILHCEHSRCFKCGAQRTFCFELDERPGPAGPVRLVNPTPQPSRALDAVQWMDLAHFYLGRIDRLKDAVERSQSLLDARQCLEEALKFYPPQADSPPPDAVWTEAGRAKVAASPQTYRRATLAAMLQRMPPLDDLRRADQMEQKAFKKGVRERARERVGRKWWQFWRLIWPKR